MDKTFFVMIRKSCLKAASAMTSCCPGYYQQQLENNSLVSPLMGHCGAVASLVQGMFGGDIVTGRVNGEPHYWNRLPNGEEFDLTSCQYGGNGYAPLRKGRKLKPRKLVHPRFLLFAKMVQEELGRNSIL